MWIGLPAAGVIGGVLAETGVLDTTTSLVLLAVALLVVAGLVLGFYARGAPVGWLLHLTSGEAATAMTAGQ